MVEKWLVYVCWLPTPIFRLNNLATQVARNDPPWSQQRHQLNELRMRTLSPNRGRRRQVDVRCEFTVALWPRGNIGKLQRTCDIVWGRYWTFLTLNGVSSGALFGLHFGISPGILPTACVFKLNNMMSIYIYSIIFKHIMWFKVFERVVLAFCETYAVRPAWHSFRSGILSYTSMWWAVCLTCSGIPLWFLSLCIRIL